MKYSLDSQVRSFSLDVLSKLRSKGEDALKSAPTTKLRQWGSGKNPTLSDADLMCFPWAIVEIKKGKEESILGTDRNVAQRNEQFCYCQAANASAEALTLRENLAVAANDPSELHDGLVIFSITCVGPSVKLWITYRRKPVSVPAYIGTI
jgi:hypothetical protein